MVYIKHRVTWLATNIATFLGTRVFHKQDIGIAIVILITRIFSKIKVLG